MHVKSVVKMLLINFRAAEQRKKVKKGIPHQKQNKRRREGCKLRIIRHL